MAIETLARFPGGWVDLVEFSEKTGRVTKIKQVTPAIAFSNGISISPDRGTVAVASSIDSDVYLFDRDMSSNDLTFNTTVHTPFHPDNLDYGEDGTLYVAGHPSFPALMRLAAGQEGAKSGSWALMIKPALSTISADATATTQEFGDMQAPIPAPVRTTLVRTHALTTIYQSDGSEHGGYGSSSGVVVDWTTGVVFVTGLYAKGLLQCESISHL